MSKCLFVRKVPFKLPPKNRLVWGLILAENAGVSLLFVRKPDDHHQNMIVAATENVSDRIFEPVAMSHFPLENNDLETISDCFQTLSRSINTVDLDDFFSSLNDD